MINYMSNEKVMIIHLIVGLMLMIFHEKKMMFFPKNIVVLVWWKYRKVELDLYNYATKSDVESC